MTTTPSGVTAQPDQLERALFEVKKVIVGQDRVIERILVCLLSRGHCLLEGVPGVAKTLAVETIARVTGGSFTRIQFTPDLLPSDLIGTRIYRQSSERFDVELGPIFANFVLADEINRAPAKVQSALLEVMAERQVSIGGTTYPAPTPFLVLATQNPIESEGVYPLPEAQRDRFLMKINVGYPTPAEEVQVVVRMGVSAPQPEQILGLDQLVALQELADRVWVDQGVIDYAVSLVLATRDPSTFTMPDLAPLISYGASPRASLGLVRAARALALMRGRSYALPQDVFDVAPDILRHRLVLTYEALAQEKTPDHVLSRILGTVPAPSVSPRQSGRPAPSAAPAAPASSSPPPPPPTGPAPEVTPPPPPPAVATPTPAMPVTEPTPAVATKSVLDEVVVGSAADTATAPLVSPWAPATSAEGDSASGSGSTPESPGHP